MELPEPIDHPACSKCPYNTLCCSYLNEKDLEKLSESHSIRRLAKDITAHLTKDHIEYVTRWVSLLQLEEVTENMNIPGWKDIWTLEPHKR